MLTLTASAAVPAEVALFQRLRSVPVSQTLSAESVCHASHAVLAIHQGLGSTVQYIFIEQKAPQEQTNETSNEEEKPKSSCTTSCGNTAGPWLLCSFQPNTVFLQALEHPWALCLVSGSGQ